MNERTRLSRMVNGGVTDAFNRHPEYLTPAGRKWAASSIAKRVSGTIWGYVEQSAKSRGLTNPADMVEERTPVSLPAGDAVQTSPATFPVRLRLKSIKHKPGLGPVGRRRLAARINTHLALREAQHG